MRTVHEVATAITGVFGRGRVQVEPSQAKHHEARLLQLNCDKAHQLLGWQPRWHVDKTLEATALWYKKVLEGGDAKAITRAQLRDYFPELP